MPERVVRYRGWLVVLGACSARCAGQRSARGWGRGLSRVGESRVSSATTRMTKTLGPTPGVPEGRRRAGRRRTAMSSPLASFAAPFSALKSMTGLAQRIAPVRLDLFRPERGVQCNEHGQNTSCQLSDNATSDNIANRGIVNLICDTSERGRAGTVADCEPRTSLLLHSATMRPRMAYAECAFLPGSCNSQN
jgi:hypothetical protein